MTAKKVRLHEISSLVQSTPTARRHSFRIAIVETSGIAAADLTAEAQVLSDATVAALAAWPALAARMVDTLANDTSRDPAVRPTVVDALAAELARRMLKVASALATLTAADAAAQGVDNPSAKPDRARIERVAATFAARIAAGYAAAAVDARLHVPVTEASRLRTAASAVASAVRTALTALGTALSGLVPTYVGAAMAAGAHEGRRSVFEAHPPRYLVADERPDPNRCGPCAEVDGRRYRTLAAALEDYPTVGYRLCKGGVRCRGRLRAVWREPNSEAAATSRR